MNKQKNVEKSINMWKEILTERKKEDKINSVKFKLMTRGACVTG